ncbi:hypothetical protein J3E73DRAFT_395168 [Bipolaris maydis]|nr:hypothetical protein J3E73DRAFT_395168 [Bipolaris maydis]
MPRQLRREDYTVGWVCALPIELAAAQEMLDEEHPDLKPDASDNDENLYALGSIGGHNVVIVCLPAGQIGNNPAAAVAMQMRATFKKIRFGLMVGIGGGVPNAEDVRLGDVVASQPHGTFAGVVQYDMGKKTPSGFERTGSLNAPPKILLAAIAKVQSNELRGKSKLSEYVAKLESNARFQRNKAGPDVLFEAAYDHEADDHEAGQTCDGTNEIVVHYGTIASGNQVMRSAIERDEVSKELGGVFPCLVVRGICDYADSHKNKRWQPYAAAVAAAYAKEVLLVIPPAEVAELRTAEEATQFTKHNSERPRSPIAKRRKIEGIEDLGIDTVELVHLIILSLLIIHANNVIASTQLSPQQHEHRFHDIHTAVDTCEWLFEHPGYQTWMESDSGLFWIKGDPGAGKSVLMKHCVKRMRERSPDNLVVSFFFHGQGKPLQKTSLGLFRALLSSMLEHFPENLTRLAAKCTENEKRYGRHAWEWTENELQEAFSNTLSEATRRQRVVIFIDALDECGRPRKEFIGILQRRDLPDKNTSGEDEWPGYTMVRPGAIERHHEPETKREQIQAEILSKSNGGFQWSEKLLEEIAHLPKTLSKMYETILNGVPAASQHQMAKIFQWVLFAERPLSAQELRDALAADKDMSYRTVRDLRTHEGWSDTLVESNLLPSRELWEQYELNGPDSDREAQLIHQSVADFLTEKFASLFGNHLPAAHSLIGSSQTTDIKVLSSVHDLEDVLEDATLPRGTISSKYPLAPYAIRFLVYAHQENMRKLATLWRTLDPNSRYKPREWPFIQATALHVSVAFGSMSAVDILLESGFKEFEGRDADGNTPLMLAITEGHQDIALVLLDRVVDCRGQHRQPDADAECDVTSTPVACATVITQSNNVSETALDLALETGANLNYLGRESALVAHAISSRNTELLSILIEKKLKLDGAVFFALKDKLRLCDVVLKDMIFQLLSAGANTARSSELNAYPEEEYPKYNDKNAADGNYDTDALALASRSGLTDVVERLLHHGAPAALQNFAGQCPLSIAAQYGHKETEDYVSDTALSLAVENDNSDIVKILLEGGTFSTPTTCLRDHFVKFASDGATTFVEIVLQRKLVHPDIQDTHGRTALSQAAEEGHEMIIKLLLDTGKVDPDTKDKNGFTPLLYAGWTPLLWAVCGGREGVVKQLLDTGKQLLDTGKVDADSRDREGWTPLLWAAHKGYEGIVKQLLDTGKIGHNIVVVVVAVVVVEEEEEEKP